MARLTASQRLWRERVDTALVVLGPPMGLALGAFERASRLIGGAPRDHVEPEPSRVPLDEPRR